MNLSEEIPHTSVDWIKDANDDRSSLWSADLHISIPLMLNLNQSIFICAIVDMIICVINTIIKYP